MLKLFHENGRNWVTAAQLFANQYPDRPIPHRTTFIRLQQKFEETSSVGDRDRTGRPKTATDDDSATNVVASFEVQPVQSLRQVARDAGMSHTSVYIILRSRKFHPYKLRFHQELLENDNLPRLQLCHWVQLMKEHVPRLASDIMFSDEALFYLNGNVHHHAFRYWSQKNPRWMLGTKKLNSPRIMVWCGIWRGQIVGPFFFQGTVTAESYLHMLETFLWPFLENVPVQHRQNMWYQCDGASAHFALIVRDWMNRTFGQRWIGRGGPIEWPARSPDLTPLDYFLWGYVKCCVFRTQPVNIELVERIRQVVREITPEMIGKVYDDFYARVDMCMQENGAYFEHLL